MQIAFDTHSKLILEGQIFVWYCKAPQTLGVAMLSGLGTDDDPGIRSRRALRLLQASNAISAHRRRHPLRPRWMAVAEALTVALITAVVAGWIIATP
jgi:hypothetical protein